jgi:hypothetical protein
VDSEWTVSSLDVYEDVHTYLGWLVLSRCRLAAGNGTCHSVGPEMAQTKKKIFCEQPSIRESGQWERGEEGGGEERRGQEGRGERRETIIQVRTPTGTDCTWCGTAHGTEYVSFVPGNPSSFSSRG